MCSALYQFYVNYSFLTGANPNSKRKAIWTVEDVTKIEITKKSEILKPIDLHTAPHILISSAKSINKQDEREQLIKPTGNIILSFGLYASSFI